MLDTVHRQFIQVVKDGRAERLKDDPLSFIGMFWSGEESLSLGHIDGYGDRRQVTKVKLKLETILDLP